MDRITQLSTSAKLNVTGLVLTAAGMLLQIFAGSTLYPTISGPAAMLATAALVVLIRARWTSYVALIVPLLLGVGAFITALISGGFISQLTGFGEPAIVVGSVMHVIGIVAAVAGGLGMVLGPSRLPEQIAH
jgi:hypothetical protein